MEHSGLMKDIFGLHGLRKPPLRAPLNALPGMDKQEPPACTCCGAPCKATAYLDHDGWALSWDCCADVHGEPTWPFAEEFAMTQDFLSIGWDVA